MNLSELHKLGILASIDADGGLKLDAPKGALNPALIETIRQSKQALLSEIMGGRERCEDGEHGSLCMNPACKGIDHPEHLHHDENRHPEITTETPLTTTSDPTSPEPVSYGSLPTVPDSDDRRTCAQCRNLASKVCSVAKPGGIVSANRGYRPNPAILLRCIGYLPNQSDNDHRSGAERWPGLNHHNETPRNTPNDQ